MGGGGGESGRGERERGREGEREGGREGERERGREGGREREREREGEREREREREEGATEAISVLTIYNSHILFIQKWKVFILQ